MSKFIKIAAVKRFSSIKEFCDYLYRESKKLSGYGMIGMFYQFNEDHGNVFDDIRVSESANHKVISLHDLSFPDANPTMGINMHYKKAGQTFPYAGEELSKFLLKAFFLREKAKGVEAPGGYEKPSAGKSKKRKRASTQFQIITAQRWQKIN
jgi:hypothetical protein